MGLSLFGSEKIPVPDAAVGKDAVEYSLLQSIVDYVNIAQNEGMYLPRELPSACMPAYYTDLYYAQVCNGGHAQYLHNANPTPNVENWTRYGLKRAGLDELGTCFEEVVADKERADLERLDSAFFASCGSYHVKMNAWLSKHIKTYSEKKYEKKLMELRQRDRKRQDRYRDIMAQRLQAHVENPIAVGVGLAATKMDHSEIHLRAGRFKTFMGQEVTCWHVRTEKSVNGVHALYSGDIAIVPTEPPDVVSDQEIAEAFMAHATIIEEAEIAEAIAKATELRPGVLAFLLAGENASVPSTSALIPVHADRAVANKCPPDAAMYFFARHGTLGFMQRKVHFFGLDGSKRSISYRKANRMISEHAARLVELEKEATAFH